MNPLNWERWPSSLNPSRFIIPCSTLDIFPGEMQKKIPAEGLTSAGIRITGRNLPPPLGLEVYVNLGIGPILSGDRVLIRKLLKKFPSEEVAIPDLPPHFVVLEEHGVDHIDLLPE